MAKNPYQEQMGGRKLQATRRAGAGNPYNKALKSLTSKKGYVPITTGARRGTRKREEPFPPPPMTFKGTLPEWAVYWAHGVLNRKEHRDFAYLYYTPESPNGIDFYEFDLNLGIEIQGLYWHYGFGGFKIRSDIERKVRIEGLGMTLIYIDEDHALKDPVYYLREALAGRDHSRATRGTF